MVLTPQQGTPISKGLQMLAVSGVLKTKTPKTPKTPETLKLENKDPPIFWGAPKLRPAGRQQDWKLSAGDKNFERGIKVLNLLLAVFKTVSRAYTQRI